MTIDPRARNVWPEPPEGLQYVRQTLTGGEYISTGLFRVGTVDDKGRGRTFDQCERVTSLFFDIDLLGLYDSVRQSRGRVLEARAQDRKRRMYKLVDSQRDAMLDLMLRDFVPQLESVIGLPASVVLMSGWGYHAHFAVAADIGAEKVALRAVHAAVVDSVNLQVAELAGAMSPPLTSYVSAWDRTHDVGARLCRLPGSTNRKAGGRHYEVEILQASETVLQREDLVRLQDSLCMSVDQAVDVDPVNIAPKPGKPRQSRRVEVDFRMQRLPDGRTWQACIDGLGPGERTKIVCPFGGTSIGSGFFAREPDGRTRYYSAPSATTYWNTYTAPKASGLAELVRMPPKKKGGVGEIAKSVGNLIAMLTHDTTFDLWYDSFAEREMNGGDTVDDTTWIEILAHMEGAYGWYWRIGRETLYSTIELVCRQHTRNPVQEYVDGLKWDGRPRLERLFIDALGCEDLPVFRAYARRFMLGLMARLYSPGSKMDTVVCLQGRQGLGKSQFLRRLVDLPGFKGQLFSDTRLNLRDKDSYLQLYSCWLYEDAELASGSTADQETRKAFIASSVDRLRPPFGRKVRTYRRHTVICATTNERDFLRDKTGDRRYWVVPCADRPADLEHIDTHRDQMFAEARDLYRAGEQWWLTAREEALRGQSNAAYRYLDWYTQCAMTAYTNNGGGAQNRFSCGEFASAIGKDVNPQGRGLTLSAALQRAGFTKMRSNGVTYYLRELADGEAMTPGNGLDAIATLSRAPKGRVLREVWSQA
jgi:hypothetical protein